MKFVIDSTTDNVQSTDGIALAAKISVIYLLNRTTISPVEVPGRKYIPVDADVSPLDNSTVYLPLNLWWRRIKET